MLWQREIASKIPYNDNITIKAKNKHKPVCADCACLIAAKP